MKALCSVAIRHMKQAAVIADIARFSPARAAPRIMEGAVASVREDLNSGLH